MGSVDGICLKLTGQSALVVWHQLLAIYENIRSWLLVLIGVRRTAQTLAVTTRLCAGATATAATPQSAASAVFVMSPGGHEALALEALGDTVCTLGYNVKTIERLPGSKSLCHVPEVPSECAVVRITAFSVNYADVCIRWGLYESALRFVGYPVCPGFDFAGVVERAGDDAGFKAGDQVFGITFFGAYSGRVLVPGRQLRALPSVKGSRLSDVEAAALPSVAGTALHALRIAGFWPTPPPTFNRAVLVHSAAGGVGSMLVQMAKLLGCAPVVAVVGGAHKVA